ncbi:type II toxin-antitoxin system PemK/MazF family toxin [bacterium]|nr:type II toxin-antitoxin system PemK/MazF family toxin [bacterium]NDC94330.1 type II toxin-antitoxin system PemK/MazF family toxin [bacterium]NDG30329.1 type II toxin-antitoxin system PemK/MazF family toxin [bacterium]
MERPLVGSVVVTRFPYSDLKSYKVRPVLVIAHGDFGDLILCQITSISDGSLSKITLKNADFKSGGLPVDSFIRPDKIFTSDQKLIVKTAGVVSDSIMKKVRGKLAGLFNI